MNITIIGGGRVGHALGSRWAGQGHRITYGVRDPDALKVSELLSAVGPQTKAKSVSESVQDADVVVLATPWGGTQDAIESAGDLSNKILIDCTNPLKPDMSGLAVSNDSSAAEQIAQWAKNARVVKAFNSTGSKNMENPHYDSGPISMFICGDDADAKATVSQLASEIGFEVIDTGALSAARFLEPLALLWISLAYGRGYGPDFAITLVKR